MKFQNIKISGIAGAVPKTKIDILKNHDFVSVEEREKTIRLTGISTYRKASSEQTTADFCEVATKTLLEDINVKPDIIDGIIFVTMSPDYIAPSTACVLQDKIGLLKNTIAFDVNLGCSGYVYGLYIACSLIQGGGLKRVLLLTGDTQTKMIHPEDKNVSFLFGDAGTATLVEFENGAPEIKMKLMTDGSRKDSLIIPAGGFRQPSNSKTRQVIEQEDRGFRSLEHIYLDGMGVFNFSITDVVQTIDEFLIQEKIDLNQVDYLILHQANKFMTDKIAKKLNFLPEQVPYSLDTYGNTSSASIPMTMIHSFSKTSQNIQHCILSGFGIGLSWGVIDITLKNTNYSDIIEI